jgi:hypothetical protein
MNVASGITVAVVEATASRTSPLPIRKFQVLMDMSTIKTGFGRWIEAVNQADDFPFDVRDVLEDAHELGSGQVAYFAPPQSFGCLLGAFHGQVFKE